MENVYPYLPSNLLDIGVWLGYEKVTWFSNTFLRIRLEVVLPVVQNKSSTLPFLLNVGKKGFPIVTNHEKMKVFYFYLSFMDSFSEKFA